MSGVGVWQTLSGAVFLTHDAIGFGYYSAGELAKLQHELEQGLWVNDAAGFSGTVYPYNTVHRVEVDEPAKCAVVHFRDLVLTDEDDFNFHTETACREFCAQLLQNLGPDWVRSPTPKRRFSLIAILITLAFFLTLSVAFGIFSLVLGGEFLQSGLICSAVSIPSLVGVVYWLRNIFKYPAMVDAIRKREQVK